MKKYIKIAAGTAAAAAAVYAAAETLFLRNVLHDAKENRNDKCKYLLILGSEVTGECTPGNNLVCRMRKAAAYMKENPQVIAVPCGGCFRPQQKLSEAQIIKNYLTENGIADDRFILEDKSTTTVENFVFAKKLIENHSGMPVGKNDIAVLTSDYHLYRAGLIARMQGFGQIKKVAAKTDIGFIKGALREALVAPQLIEGIL